MCIDVEWKGFFYNAFVSNPSCTSTLCMHLNVYTRGIQIKSVSSIYLWMYSKQWRRWKFQQKQNFERGNQHCICATCILCISHETSLFSFFFFPLSGLCSIVFFFRCFWLLTNRINSISCYILHKMPNIAAYNVIDWRTFFVFLFSRFCEKKSWFFVSGNLYGRMDFICSIDFIIFNWTLSTFLLKILKFI